MHDPDLEADSVPIFAPCKLHLEGKQFFKRHAKNSIHMKDDDKFDSGFHSSRNESLQSLNLGSEITECRVSSNEEKLIPVSNFWNLLITIDVEPYVEGCDLKSEVIEKGEDHNYVECVDVETENTRMEIEEIFIRDDDNGDTHLHIAIIQLMEYLALYYIQLAPDHNCLNIRNNYLQTPLHLAVITKQPLIARKLITSGALVDARDHKGNSPLHIASKEGYAIAAKVLLEPVRFEELNKNRNQLPYQRIPQNLEGRNYDGQVCVHLAAEGGHFETLEVLLNSGADINARDGKSGRTMLHYATESACMPLLKFLLKYPTLDINAVTYGGLTAVMLAKGCRHEEVVNILKEHGAYYDSQDSDEENMAEDCYDNIQINRTSIQQFQ